MTRSLYVAYDEDHVILNLLTLRAGSVKNLSEDHVILNEVKNLDDRDEITMRCFTCFGNYVGRPVAKRSYRPLFPHILDVRVRQLALEFANRELAELELWGEFPSDKELAAGLVDVKNYYIETPEDVAERIRAALHYVA